MGCCEIRFSVKPIFLFFKKAMSREKFGGGKETTSLKAVEKKNGDWW